MKTYTAKPGEIEPGIRQCLDLTYATAAHQTIWEYAPRSRAAEDYSRLVAWLGHGAAAWSGDGQEDQAFVQRAAH